MSRLNRMKSMSCSEIRFSINGIPVTADKEFELYLNEDKYFSSPLSVPRGSSTTHTNHHSPLHINTGNHHANGRKPRPRPRFNSSSELVDMVDRSLIGKDVVYNGPFGPRQVIYLDHTASGKPLKCIEDFIQENILPYYANTHTVSSFTSVQTTAYRDEARELLRQATGGEADDVVLFHGAGTTCCVHKLVHHVFYNGDLEKRPKIVFVGPFEHHSNILPWEETGAQIVTIHVNKYGLIDTKYLKMKLKEITRETKNVDLIGCFSVASNVTGVISDDVALTILMHKYGGLAFFDYAAGAPHVKVIMNPKLEDKQLELLARKDGIYFSGHKFMGGPQTTGVLVAKCHIFKNPVPHGVGGGTVHLNIIEREEGGTPSIVENIRLGLVMKLKMSIGEENIIAREAYFTKKAFSSWSTVSNLIILGDTTNPRIPIVSFLIEHVQSGYYLHHNFVATLLNDLFGIQARGGCMCAGPYSQILLDIDEELAKDYENIFARPGWGEDETGDDLLFKPGFTRISFPYHASPEEVDYTIEAITFLAENGWKLLPLYKCNKKTAAFSYANPPTNVSRARSLNSCNFGTNGLEFDNEMLLDTWNNHPTTFKESIEYANNILRKLHPRSIQIQDLIRIDPASEKLRWFLLPSEALQVLQNPTHHEIKAPHAYSAKKVQFKIKSIRRVKSESYEGSVVDQVLSSVWGNEKHLLTRELVAEDLRVRNARRGSNVCLTNFSSDDSTSTTSGDTDYRLEPSNLNYRTMEVPKCSNKTEPKTSLLTTNSDMDKFITHFGKSLWLS